MTKATTPRDDETIAGVYSRRIGYDVTRGMHVRVMESLASKRFEVGIVDGFESPYRVIVHRPGKVAQHVVPIDLLTR